MTAALAAIRRYPVKGLAGQDLTEAGLVPGRGLPQDRRWAIAHAAGEFDTAAPAWLPKRHFVQLLTEERLALLDIDYAEDPPVLQLMREGRRVARGDLAQPIGRELINQFLAAFLKDGRGTPKIVEAPGVQLHLGGRRAGTGADVHDPKSAVASGHGIELVGEQRLSVGRSVVHHDDVVEGGVRCGVRT